MIVAGRPSRRFNRGKGLFLGRTPHSPWASGGLKPSYYRLHTVRKQGLAHPHHARKTIGKRRNRRQDEARSGVRIEGSTFNLRSNENDSVIDLDGQTTSVSRHSSESVVGLPGVNCEREERKLLGQVDQRYPGIMRKLGRADRRSEQSWPSVEIYIRSDSRSKPAPSQDGGALPIFPTKSSATRPPSAEEI